MNDYLIVYCKQRDGFTTTRILNTIVTWDDVTIENINAFKDYFDCSILNIIPISNQNDNPIKEDSYLKMVGNLI